MDDPEVSPTGRYVIYALIDPTDHRVCYVGQTRDPRSRLFNHLSKKYRRGEKAVWLQSLEEKGYRPIMQILERVMDKETALAREQVWIRRFLERGMPLFNGEAKTQEQLDSSYLKQILFPTHQETAVICGCRVTKVRLPNGQTAIILRDLSTQLAIAPNWQSQQIRSDPILFNYLVYVRIKTSGGPQIAAAILEGALPLWLASLRLTHISLEQREEIYALQRKATDVLCDYFSRMPL